MFICNDDIVLPSLVSMTWPTTLLYRRRRAARVRTVPPTTPPSPWPHRPAPPALTPFLPVRPAVMTSLLRPAWMTSPLPDRTIGITPPAVTSFLPERSTGSTEPAAMTSPLQDRPACITPSLLPDRPVDAPALVRLTGKGFGSDL